MTNQERQVLAGIVMAQFMSTSLWFAGNAVIPQVITLYDLNADALGTMTSSVQLGFIIGTLIYAFFTIADRFNASSVFLWSAIFGAVANALITVQETYTGILIFRFLTGVFLAGVYPVGMKIASDHFEKGLGKAMSFLVGALVLGTALPHFMASLNSTLDWKSVLYGTSFLAFLGGVVIKMFVGEGRYKKASQEPSFRDIRSVFKNRKFRNAAFGYFGHMWELYAFWAFVPVILASNKAIEAYPKSTLSMLAFIVIAFGAFSCVAGGFFAEKFGTKRMAFLFLMASGICCLLSPFAISLDGLLFIPFMIFWGLVVIADSPLFSTLVAQNVNPAIKGTAISLVTSIGFALTIISIQALSFLAANMDGKYIFTFLITGPLFGSLSIGKVNAFFRR